MIYPGMDFNLGAISKIRSIAYTDTGRFIPKTAAVVFKKNTADVVYGTNEPQCPI